MSLTSSMMVGFSGIRSNSVGVDVVGDNLANLNTTAFKGQRVNFETLLYRTIAEGEGPSATSGGVLPRQIGTGTQVSAIQRNFEQGAINNTGFPTDFAIDGDGFFVLSGAQGQPLYTRDGALRLDASQTLVSATGDALQVFTANADGTIDTGTLSDLAIPLGSASAAVATDNVILDGQLDSATTVSSAGAVVTSQTLTTAGGVAATSGTALTALVDRNGVPLFAAGDSLSFGGQKGGVSLAPTTFVVGQDGSTLGDLAGRMQAVYGINTDAATGTSPGVTIGDGSDFPAGSLVVRSNVGDVNAITLDASSIVNQTGANVSPFSFNTVEPSVGEGVTTSFGVFDSLGNLVNVRVRATVESKSDTGITWRFFAESVDDSDVSPSLGTGTVTFDPNGQFVGSTGTDLTIDRAGIGSGTPANFSLDFSGLTGLASADGDSNLFMASQDGSPTGVMNGFSVDRDGVVTAAFSNQETQVLGQVALATFRNNEGMVAVSNNTYVEGPDSGNVELVTPQTGLSGAVLEGALEQANVEIAREFISLIQSQTGITSASRVVRVADELLQELLLLAR